MHSTTSYPILIVGAGHCGGRTAQLLREGGWQGAITLVGMEHALPYERPALSKEVLTGGKGVQALDLYSAQDFAAMDIQHYQAQVTAVDPQRRTASLSTGSVLPYSTLLFANGGLARQLSIPGHDLPQAMTLRTKADAVRLAPLLQAGRSIAIIGGGFIGLEVAASARTLGCAVSLVEGAPRLMGRAVPALLAERARALHQARGVDLHLGVNPLHIAASGDGVQIGLSDGTVLQADIVLVGIGIVAQTAVAQAAGVAIGRANGILVDRQLRTNVPGIFAAGDIAEFPAPRSGLHCRQETWQNAESQARVAAHNLTGGAVEMEASAWFWSDQYDYQLQVCGEPAAAVQTTVREQEDGDVLVFYGDADHRLVGACGWGLATRIAKDLKIARTLVERAVIATPQQLSDPALKLKSLLK